VRGKIWLGGPRAVVPGTGESGAEVLLPAGLGSGPAHTTIDVVVWIPGRSVLFAGHLLFSTRPPVLTWTSMRPVVFVDEAAEDGPTHRQRSPRLQPTSRRTVDSAASVVQVGLQRDSTVVISRSSTEGNLCCPSLPDVGPESDDAFDVGG